MTKKKKTEVSLAATKSNPGEAKPNPKARALKPVRDRVSGAFRDARSAKAWTLQNLAKYIAANSQGEIESISTAHLSRIETNQARPSDVELYWINEALGRPLGELFGGNDPPWYKVSAAKIEERLQEIIEGTRKIHKRDDAKAHQMLIDQKIYRYVPLEPDGGDDFVSERSSGSELGEMKRQNSISFMEIKPVGPEVFKQENALEGHEGQEAIYCLDGEMYFLCVRSSGERIETRMTPGDFVRFDSQQRHGFRAVGPNPAHALHIYSNAIPNLRNPVATERD